MATTKYNIRRVYDNRHEDYDNIEAVFLERAEDSKVVLATLTNGANRKCYYWQAEGYKFDFKNGFHGTVSFEIAKNNHVEVYTAYKKEKVSTIAELFKKGGVDVDDIDGLSKYKILGEETPKKVTNADLMEAINRLTELVLKLEVAVKKAEK